MFLLSKSGCLQVLCGVSVKWQKCKEHDIIPENVIDGGYIDYGFVCFIGRVNVGGELHIGKVSTPMFTCLPVNVCSL